MLLDEGVIDLGLDLGPTGGEGGSLVDMGEGGEEVSWAPMSEVDGELWVRVTLDGAPLPDALITQGGSARSWRTDERGLAYVQLDTEALDELTLFASHSEARTRPVRLSADQRAPAELQLTQAARPDEPLYDFSDPGRPGRRESTAQCGHCHQTNNDAWYESPHRSAAKNPTVYDLYMGRASGLDDEDSCLARGGRWALAQQEGRDDEAWQCFQEISALGAFNERCEQPPCDTRALATEEPDPEWGGCADCHAPAINGVRGGGQDLLSARGHAFEYGVSCDLCHHVDQLDWSAPAGVGGRLSLWRPQEPGPITLGAGGFLPLSFGPSPDVSNPRMGISPRPHYRSGELCGGCHQHNHEDEHAKAPLNAQRWPDGALPNQSTYAEWLEGPVSEVAACNACHMPPLSALMNAGNLERFELADIGIQAGWPRPHGEARSHSWWGPRQPQAGMLRLAGGLKVELSPISSEGTTTEALLAASPERIAALEERGDQLWRVTATTSNLGAGHGLPTGEPMRHMITLIELRCGGELGELVGGDVVHSIGGAVSQHSWAPLSELRLPHARPGDLLRVTRPLSSPLPYVGYGPFGSAQTPSRVPLPEGARWVGRVLSEEERGLERTLAVGELLITEVSPEGALSLSDRSGAAVTELWGQAGDELYVQRPDELEAEGYAGAAGFSFARVMVNASGQEMVPHFAATDVARDNRLMPGQRWRSEHLFSAPCEEPSATAHLIYRAYPLWLARERGWRLDDELMLSVSARAGSAETLPIEPLTYPTPGEGEPEASLTVTSTLSERIEDLKRSAVELGVDLEREREGDALAISPLPTLWRAPQERSELEIHNPLGASEELTFTQSAWAQDQASGSIEPGGSLRLTLTPTQWGVASYELRRGEELWRGALVSLPQPLEGLSQAYHLSLGRAEARAATRRARPWPWRLEEATLSPRLLSPDPEERPALSSVDLSAPQALLNQSSLPVLIDLPRGVQAWGADSAPTRLDELTPRAPQPEPSHELGLLIPPGAGVILWASEPLASGAELTSLGYSAHGGRSWSPSVTLATLTSASAPDDELLAALEVTSSGELSADERRAQVASALRALLGEPVSLEGPSSLEELTRLPSHTLSRDREATRVERSRLGLPQISARWVYQGDRRAGAWRVSGGESRPHSPGSLLEVRNLSAQGQPFAIEGHLHELVTETGARAQPRATSWIPARGRALVIWPTDPEAQSWKAGALHSPEAGEGLSVSPSPSR